MAIIVNLNAMIKKRNISTMELSERLGITIDNISILKNNKAKAIRFSTLDTLCKILDCRPEDILDYVD